MPILIKGSGGAQDAPAISVSTSGLITATSGSEATTKQLSSADDADFIASNIKKGKNIFGLAGSLEALKIYGNGEELDNVTVTANGKTMTVVISDTDITTLYGFCFVISDVIGELGGTVGFLYGFKDGNDFLFRFSEGKGLKTRTAESVTYGTNGVTIYCDDVFSSTTEIIDSEPAVWEGFYVYA